MENYEIKFGTYTKRGNQYVRARANVVLLNGELLRIEGTGKNRVDARENLLKNIEKRNEIITYGRMRNAGYHTLYEAVLDLIKEREEEYDREREREARRDTSIQRDYDVCNSLLKPFTIAQKPINQIGIVDLQQYRNQLAKAQYDKKRTKKKHEPEWTYYSASTLNRMIRLVVKVLDDFYLYKPQKTPTEVLTQFKQRRPEKTEDDFLIGNEVKTAIVYFREKRKEAQYPLDITYADMFILSILLGTRPGEIMGLKKKDWNPQNRELSILRTAEYEDGRTKTASSIRKIIVPKEAEDILNRRCSTIKTEKLIFSSTKGNMLSPSNCNRKLKRWIAEAGINKPKIHPHSLRGTCGTVLLDAGIRIEAVSKLLGHDRVSTTEQYYSTYTESRRKADAEQICGVFDKL